MGMTQAGAIMGTAAYMSPEQAAGLPVDRRADIWSFGVVLWEMLNGKRLFTGDTVAHTLAAVLQRSIDFDTSTAPGPIRDLLERCLDRDVRTRLRDIGEARIAITRYLADPQSGAPPNPASLASPASIGRGKLAWILAAIGIIATLTLGFLHFRERPPVTELTRFELGAPTGSQFTNFLSISPDGRKIAFTARTGNDGNPRLWVRSLETLEAKALTGTATNPYPFWSPDSRFIAYQVEDKLKKIDIAGGPPVTLCESGNAFRGGAWSVDANGTGTIIFGSQNAPLKRVSDQGGQPVEITKLDADRQEGGHVLPSMLPDGRNFVYLRRSSNLEQSGIYLGSLDFKPEQQASRRLLAGDLGAVYAASPGGSTMGHVLFMRESTLFSQPFDESKLALTGEAVPVAESVATGNPRGYFSASANGALIYRTGESARSGLKLTWFDRQGKMLGTVGDAAPYADTLRLSPDGTRVAVTRIEGSNPDIWLVELARGVSSKFTFDQAADLAPIWSRDGSRIAFRSNRGGHFDLYQKVANGAGEDELLFKSDLDKIPGSFSRDGRFLLFHSNADPKTKADQWVLPFSEAKDGRKPVPFVNAPYNEGFGVFSPDMKWIAYQSDATGRDEIYVRPFIAAASASGSKAATAEGQWQVSKDGARFPHWSADGKEIFFASARGIMSAEVGTAGGFRAGTPQLLFVKPIGPNEAWDVTADGKKFLFAAAESGDAGAAPAPIIVVMNWQALLKK